MKSNKGITLVSLVIYVIGLMIIITLMSLFSGYFFKNTNQMTIQENEYEQYLRLISYITKDTNADNLAFVKTANNSNVRYAIFKYKNGQEHQYIFTNGVVYFVNIDSQTGSANKKITLCPSVSNAIFDYYDKKIDISIRKDAENYRTTLNVNI